MIIVSPCLRLRGSCFRRKIFNVIQCSLIAGDRSDFILISISILRIKNVLGFVLAGLIRLPLAATIRFLTSSI